MFLSSIRAAPGMAYTRYDEDTGRISRSAACQLPKIETGGAGRR
jgi:hypothetical protein